MKQTDSPLLEITRREEEERGWAGTAGKYCTRVFLLWAVGGGHKEKTRIKTRISAINAGKTTHEPAPEVIRAASNRRITTQIREGTDTHPARVWRQRGKANQNTSDTPPGDSCRSLGDSLSYSFILWFCLLLWRPCSLYLCWLQFPHHETRGSWVEW